MMIRVLATLFSALLLLIAAAVVAGSVMFHRYGKDLPDIRQLATYEPAVTTRVYSGDGRLLAEYAAEKRVFVPIGSIPPRLAEAFLSAEDKNFYKHSGIDTTGVIRAIVTNLENFGSDRRLVGASTIPQQVAKNFLLSGEVSFDRKIKEAILAFRMGQALSKQRILELYLNEIYLGSSAYGVAAAALNYFDKSLDELTLPEMATLAALPKGPNNYDPIRQPAAAKMRRDWVIGRMLEDGHITLQEAEEARNTPLVTRRGKMADVASADYFAEEVRRDLIRRYGEDALYKSGLVVYSTVDQRLQEIADQSLRNGLEEYDRRHGWRGPVAQLPPNMSGVEKNSGRGDRQNAARIPADWRERLAAIPVPPGMGEWQLAVLLGEGDGRIGFADGRIGRIPPEQMSWIRRRSNGHGSARAGDVIMVESIGANAWAPRQVPKVEGALVAIDPHTGRVLAMSGGWDYRRSEFNRATQAMRQPGSAFKPIVYLCALEAGYTPSSVIKDAPITLSQGPGEPAWRPMNYSNRFYGPTTLRVGLEQSRNVMTVRLAQAVGMDKVADCAKRLGVFDAMPHYLSYALGAGETTVMRLTTAFAMLVNGGRQVEPTVIDRVQDRYGKVIFRQDQRACPDCQVDAWEGQAMPEPIDLRPAVTDPHSAYQVVSMLQGVVERGTGERAQIAGRPIAGKTGTSSDAKDVWFVGFSPDLVVGVFIGYDEPASLGDHAAGGTVAAPIFANFMREALKDKPTIPFRTPPGVRLVRVDAATGRPAAAANPRVIFEAFKPGTAPEATGSARSFRSGQRVGDSPDIGTGGLY
jgi:penicillin-binding protein 1A